MTNFVIHKGGCSCGKVIYEAKGEPQISTVCKCRYCQLRSSSAFGVLVYFKEEKPSLLNENVMFMSLLAKVVTIGQIKFAKYAQRH